MVKTDTFTGPEPNLEKRLDNRLCQSVRTGNGYDGCRTVRQDGYGTRPVREGVFKSISPPLRTICASSIVERTSGEVFFESPAVGLLGFHCEST
jgi:hypothetical protein